MVDQDNKREDEWFLRNEKQLLEAARVARLEREQERRAKEEAERERKPSARRISGRGGTLGCWTREPVRTIGFIE